MSAIRRRASRISLSAALLPLALGCAGDDLAPQPDIDDADLYWSLDLNHHAVTLSTADGYDTLTFVATPRNYRGEPVAGAGVATFSSGDAEHVAVTPDGFVQALAPTPVDRLIPVFATLTVGALTYRDSALIRVTADPAPPTLASLTIRPVPPDSAKLAAVAPVGGSNVAYDITDTLVPRVTTTTGAAFEGLLVSFRSSDPKVATVGLLTGEVRGRVRGVTTIYASATAFGVALADTLRYRIGYPVLVGAAVFQDSRPGPNVLQLPTIVVGTGAMIVWNAAAADTADPVDLTFADPTNVLAVSSSPNFARYDALTAPLSPCAFDCDASGNVALRPAVATIFGITSTWGLGYVARVFPVPGVYEYVSDAPPGGGRIVVLDDPVLP